jgi:hypothetical protein
MALRDAGAQPLALGRPAIPTRHVGGRPGLVDEHQTLRIDIELTLEPLPAPLHDIWPVLLGGMGGLLWDGPSPPMTANMAVADYSQGGDGAMTIVTLGLDLGKNWIHMVGFDREGSIVLRRRARRNQLLGLTANMPACVIGMEACSGAHHLGRSLEAQGHEARLMPPQYVKPFVKANKNAARPETCRTACATCRWSVH